MARKYLVTPKGTARYPHLDKPKQWEGDEKANYLIDLIVEDNSELKKFEDELKTHFEERYVELAAGKNVNRSQHWPIRDEMDKESNQPTGRKMIRCKANSMMGDKPRRAPDIFEFDEGHPVPSRDTVHHGAICRVKLETYVWKAKGLGIGLTLQPISCLVYKNGEPFEGDTGWDDFLSEQNENFVVDQGPTKEASNDFSF